ncbi:hypothetical protein GF374_03700 [Candidatus Woesearchaeota archaeon]|nr:hypothetical protein [Candidatus Woesearchaeota archaeon]
MDDENVPAFTGVSLGLSRDEKAELNNLFKQNRLSKNGGMSMIAKWFLRQPPIMKLIVLQNDAPPEAELSAYEWMVGRLNEQIEHARGSPAKKADPQRRNAAQ